MMTNTETVGISRSASKVSRIELLLNLALFVCLCTMWLRFAFTYSQTAWDFSMFYAVAHVPLAQIYDQPVVQEYGKRVMGPLGINYYAPYLRPAAGVLLLKPLTYFPYWTAYWIFAGIQLAACIAILWLCV